MGVGVAGGHFFNGIKKWAFKMGGPQDVEDVGHLLLVEVVLLVLGHFKIE